MSIDIFLAKCPLILAAAAAVFISTAAAETASSPVSSANDEPAVRYRQLFVSAGPGVHESDSWLYVIVERPAGGRPVSDEAEALLEANAFLLEFARDRFGEAMGLPPDNPLRDRFPGLASRLRRVKPDFAWVAYDLTRLPVRVLEKRVVDGIMRLVVILRRDDLAAAARTAVSGPGMEETVHLLRKLWLEYDDPPGDVLVTEFSLLFDWLRAGSETAPPALNLRALTDTPADDPWECHRTWTRTEAMAGAPDLTASTLGRELDGLPAGPAVLFRQAGVAAGEGRFNEAALLCLLAARYADADTAAAERARAAGSLPKGDGGGEMSRLLSEFDDSQWPIELPADESPIGMVWRSFGFLEFPERCPAAAPEFFNGAITLFREGRDLPSIISLAGRAAATAPRAGEAWRLLGHALLVDGRASAAIPFLHQAVTLDGNNALARATLARAYAACGAHVLARGMAAATLACPEADDWAIRTALSILRE